MIAPQFPCRVDKTPWTLHGFKSASDDPAVIDQWTWRYPGCLWGSPIPAGVLVLDVDPRHGGDEALCDLVETYGELPATRTTRTRSGGSHYWLRTTVQTKQSAGELGPGLDTRVAGFGYVIVPPSAGYTWLSEAPIAPAPRWLIDLLPKPETKKRTKRVHTVHTPEGDHGRYIDTALANVAARIAAAPDGQHSHTINREAFGLGRLVGANLLDETTARRALTDAAEALCTKSHASNINSGFRAGQADPVQLAETA